jgi:hypothetical protein
MRTKQVRPEPTEFEFELYISKETDSLRKKDYILFDFRTTKVFESFVYKINVEQKINAEKKEIEFNIEGLSAPVIALSGTGSAGYQYKFYDFLHSEYTLKLLKQRKSKNIFKFKITKTKINITRKPSNLFIKLHPNIKAQ